MFAPFRFTREILKPIPFQTPKLTSRHTGPALQFGWIDAFQRERFSLFCFHFFNGLCYTVGKAITHKLFHCTPFHWGVGTFQFTGSERASVVAFSFPTILGSYLPTLCGSLRPARTTNIIAYYELLIFLTIQMPF